MIRWLAKITRSSWFFEWSDYLDRVDGLADIAKDVVDCPLGRNLKSIRTCQINSIMIMA